MLNSVSNFQAQRPVTFGAKKAKENSANKYMSQNNKTDIYQFPKPKMSNTQKAVISLGAIGTGIIATKLLLKGKVKEAVKLAEHIEFQKATKLEDAINFAKTNLGIELQNVKNLHVANFINENLVKLSNKAKGEIDLPKSIKITKLMKGMAGRYNPLKDSVSLSHLHWDDEFGNYIKNNQFKYLQEENLTTLYHEIGHKQHVKKVGVFKSLYQTKDYKQKVNAIKQELLEYLGQGIDTTDPAIQHFISAPGETFAQTFALTMQGKTPKGKIADLYKQLGGKIY